MNTENWTRQIDTITQQFTDAFGNLNHTELNQKPHTDTWSVAQNIEHLIRTNESYFPILDELLSGKYKKPFFGRIGFLTRFLGRMILQSVQPDRKRKIKTFSIWEPSASDISADVLERFTSHQQTLKQKIKSCAHLLDSHVVIASPANKNIVYTLDTLFDILVAHEQRHFQQAKETWIGMVNSNPQHS